MLTAGRLPSVDALTGRFRDRSKEAAFLAAQHPAMTRHARRVVAGLLIPFAGFTPFDWMVSPSLADFVPFLLLRVAGILAGLLAIGFSTPGAPPERKFRLVTLFEAGLALSLIGIMALTPGETIIKVTTLLSCLLIFYFVLPNHLVPATAAAWGMTLLFVLIEPQPDLTQRLGMIVLLVMVNGIGMAVLAHMEATRRRDHATRGALERANQQLAREVFAHHRTAAELRAATRVAEVANLAKSRFLEIATNDIRQPMQAVTLLIGALQAHALPEAARYVAGRLGEAVGAATSLLDTLHDIGRLDAGLIRAELTALPLDPLLSALAAEFASAARAKGLTLHYVRTGAVALSDAVLLERMLRNLLANAVRYTAAGGVVIGVRRRGLELHLQVWDSGIGIPAERLPVIFEEFSEPSHRSISHFDGLGLGLSIVRRLSRLLGGSVEARSTVGRGSCFTLRLPAAPLAAPTRALASMGVY
jgi:signal transduction histidine kinase